MGSERQGTFTRIYATGTVLLILITTFAIAFAIQEHNDRLLSEEITETAAELQDTGARVASIRDAEMRDMNDYIRAYSEMGPLLDTYEDSCRESLTCTPKPRNEIRAYSGSTGSIASLTSQTGRTCRIFWISRIG